jgi:hypothetical protein
VEGGVKGCGLKTRKVEELRGPFFCAHEFIMLASHECELVRIVKVSNVKELNTWWPVLYMPLKSSIKK